MKKISIFNTPYENVPMVSRIKLPNADEKYNILYGYDPETNPVTYFRAWVHEYTGTIKIIITTTDPDFQ